MSLPIYCQPFQAMCVHVLRNLKVDISLDAPTYLFIYGTEGIVN